MNTQSYGSVVAMEFRARPSIEFADIVEEFDIAFQMVDTNKRSLTWESKDIAIIDRDYVRVAMGWLPGECKGRPWHLIIAVGSAPDEDLSKIEMSSYEFVADRILERTKEYLPSTAVMRGEASQPVGPDLINTVFDLLSPETDAMARDTRSATEAQRATGQSGMEDYEDMVDTMSPPWMQEPEDAEIPVKHWNLHAEHMASKAREAVSSLGGEKLMIGHETSEPMRLTIHTLALSMCLYVPPLGAAMFAYSMMRDIFPVAAQAI